MKVISPSGGSRDKIHNWIFSISDPITKLLNSEPKVLDLGQVCQDLKLLRKFRGAAEPKVSQIVLAHSIKYNFGSKM